MNNREMLGARNEIAVIDAMEGAVTPAEIREITRLCEATLRNIVQRLVAAGVVTRLPKFEYQIAELK